MKQKNSKYFDKHYREAVLTEVQCEKCGSDFSVDYLACESLNEAWDVAAGRAEWIEYFCPYCGKRHVKCLDGVKSKMETN